MASPFQEAIETFISITGASESVAAQKLEEHGGDLNAAVNAHFNEGDRSSTRQASVAAPLDDYMEIDEPVEDAIQRHPLPLLSSARASNPFSLLDPSFTRLFDTDSDFMNRAPRVTHPREVRQIPIEVKDSSIEPSGHSGRAPIIEDVTETANAHGPVTHGAVIVEDEDDDIPTTLQTDRIPHERRRSPSAPAFENLPEYRNEIEEEMVRAAIEASKREAEGLINDEPQHGQLHADDASLAQAVSLSLKTAEQEKAFREQWPKPGEGTSQKTVVELKNLTSSNGRLEAGSSSVHDEAEDLEEQPLVRHRSRRVSPGSMESGKDIGVDDTSPPSSPEDHGVVNPRQHDGSAFASDEWGGISSLEHDEAVMLEAAMFGGVPSENRYRHAFAPHQFMQNSTYARPVPRPPSPTLEAQRMLKEQQDNEYMSALQADREREIKAQEEAEARQLAEEAAMHAALEEERRKDEESRRKFEEEQELERQLAAKEASLPQEPSSDDESAMTLLVKMPDGSRRGRRFLKSDKLQSLFDFIDIGRTVKPGTYRLVRPYPTRAFSDRDGGLTLNELGLTSKQEALFLESI
ncbi:plant UBX domain-containing protein 8 isoform X2 [Rutidosis leptorrhynchoides]|uniref:plant UBX domain-containing protein 8 isoform X2 n=1 Tax=Rutidosis leptorrhynchoides TaxID=125765 RepID=UPI003A995989